MGVKINLPENTVNKILMDYAKKYVEKKAEEIANNVVKKVIEQKISERYLKQIVRDNISRVAMKEDLKGFLSTIDSEEINKNIEDKFLLMLKNSTEFKKMVRAMLKESFKL